MKIFASKIENNCRSLRFVFLNKKYFIDLFYTLKNDQLIENEFKLLYKDGLYKKVNHLTPLMLTKSESISFYEIIYNIVFNLTFQWRKKCSNKFLEIVDMVIRELVPNLKKRILPWNLKSKN